MIKSFRRSKRLSSLPGNSPKHNISRLSSGSSQTSPINRGNGNLDDQIFNSPKRVIKALYDYRPQGPGELAFTKGDFFHVIGNVDDENEDPNGWYEATNPMTGIRGMVPMSYFEVFNRSRPAIVQDEEGELNHGVEPPKNLQYGYNERQGGPHQRNSNQSLYAVTLYDFRAERPDELDISVGENLIICAHHNFEWFIAKPINRLGGPGLVPVTFVKIIDLVNVNGATQAEFEDDGDVVKLIQTFNIPTVEQWKDQTAKYQASTIPLGSISNQTPPASSTSQFFKGGYSNGQTSNRSSLSSTNTQIVEASVDSYQLDHGRYQYLIIAKLSNGKTRYLSRFYQDFYDLQVKLLELFPYEAGKMENSKRIIPSIPGPLINVNDSISKLRREKLDYYLRNLIGLPPNISRSEEVLALFEILENGFDKEITDSMYKKEKRSLKPISQKSYYHQDRLSQYSNFHNHNNSSSTTNNNNSNTNRTSTPTSTDLNIQRPLSSSSGNLLNAAIGGNEIKQQKVKVKFYYEDDIFVLLLPTNLRLQDLKSKLNKRLKTNEEEGINEYEDSTNIQLYLKNDYDDFIDENGIEESDILNEIQQIQLQALEIDNDDKFHENMYDKCKIIIVTA